MLCLVEGSVFSGMLLFEVVEVWGLVCGVVVVGGGGDGVVSVVGIGVI